MLSLATWNSTQIIINSSSNSNSNSNNFTSFNFHLPSPAIGEFGDEDQGSSSDSLFLGEPHPPQPLESLGSVLNRTYPSYLPLVNVHWLEQEAAGTVLTAGIAAVFSLLCLVNNVCSMLLIIVFLRYYRYIV